MLYGIFPVIAAAAAASHARSLWSRRPLRALIKAEADEAMAARLHEVYRFKDPDQVQVVGGS